MRLLILVLLFPGVLSAQQLRCGYDLWKSHQYQFNRHYSEAMDLVIDNWKSGTRSGGGGVVTLPVVFHIVYNTESQNIPDEAIHAQLQSLNADYRRTNGNASETREIFLPVAADTEIQFALATTDPWGNPTSGITRTYTDRAGFSFNLLAASNTLDEVKQSATGGTDSWDTERYINIWVCNIQSSILGQIYGLAYPPAPLDNWPANANAPSANLEGVTVHYTTIGPDNPSAGEDNNSANDSGRTLVHELGHYLGLRHTWGDPLPFFQNGCTVDDGVDDTPLNASGANFQCNFSKNTCGADESGDLPDMVENYMDYAPDDCMNMFTQGQKALMRYALFNLRPGLLEGVGIRENVPLTMGVYPNPVTDFLTVQFGVPVLGVIDVWDLTGRLLSSHSVNSSEKLIDCSEWISGVYLIRLRNSRIAPVRIVVH